MPPTPEAIEAARRTGYDRYLVLCDPEHKEYNPASQKIVEDILTSLPKEPATPPVHVQVANLAGTVLESFARAISGETIRMTEEAAQARMAICLACPAMRPSDNRCADCGCYLPVAVMIAAKSCPRGLWPDPPSLGG